MNDAVTVPGRLVRVVAALRTATPGQLNTNNPVATRIADRQAAVLVLLKDTSDGPEVVLLQRAIPATFSMMNALGRSSRKARTNWGMPLRGSSAANRFPPMEKGWHGGPPATRAKHPRIALKSTVDMSASKTLASGCLDR